MVYQPAFGKSSFSFIARKSLYEETMKFINETNLRLIPSIIQPDIMSMAGIFFVIFERDQISVRQILQQYKTVAQNITLVTIENHLGDTVEDLLDNNPLKNH